MFRSGFKSRRGFSAGVRAARAKRARINRIRSAPAVVFPRRVRRTAVTRRPEMKYYDLNYNAAIVATADMSGAEADPATILCLNGVPQGDSMTTRDGQKITMQSILVTGLVNIPSQTAQSTLDNACEVFIAMVLDTQTNKAQLNSEDVYENTRSGTDAYLLAHPLRKMNFTERFKVLKTKTLSFPQIMATPNTDAGGAIVVAGAKQGFTMKVNLKGLGTKFDTSATTGAIGTIIDNSIHMVCWTNNDDFDPVLIYQSRLRFYDQ